MVPHSPSQPHSARPRSACSFPADSGIVRLFRPAGDAVSSPALPREGSSERMVKLPPRPRPGFSLVGPLLRGVVVGSVLAVVLHFGYILVGPNFRTVLAGEV